MVDQYVAEQAAMDESARKPFAERFFEKYFSKLIIGFELQPGKWKPFAYLFIAGGIAYGGVMIWGALQLSPPTAQEEWFPKAHMYTDMIARLTGMSVPVGLVCSLIGLFIGLFLIRDAFLMTENWMGAAESDYMSIAIVFGVDTFERQGDKKLNR
jgi:hypothetical protein